MITTQSNLAALRQLITTMLELDRPISDELLRALMSIAVSAHKDPYVRLRVRLAGDLLAQYRGETATLSNTEVPAPGSNAAH